MSIKPVLSRAGLRRATAADLDAAAAGRTDANSRPLESRNPFAKLAPLQYTKEIAACKSMRLSWQHETEGAASDAVSDGFAGEPSPESPDS